MTLGLFLEQRVCIFPGIATIPILCRLRCVSTSASEGLCYIGCGKVFLLIGYAGFLAGVSINFSP